MNDGRPDLALFALALGLVLLGVLMVFNASGHASLAAYGSAEAQLVRQAVAAALAIGLLVALTFVPYKKLEGLALPFVLGTALVLVLVLIPGIGRTANNAQRWLGVGWFQFQPSELAKFTVVLYLAMIMAKKKALGLTATFRGFLPPLAVLLLFFGLIFLEPDFSTAAIMLFTGLLVFFAGGVPLGHLAGLVLSSAPFLLVLVFSRGYMKSRLLTHLDPLADASEKGYQLVQSLLAFQNGGIFGVGLGKGTQKFGRLPEAHTDFIIPAHAEEIGFVGVALLLLLLGWLVLRLFRVAAAAPDDFGRFFAYGAGVLVGWQALVNVGMVTGLLPTTGLPFPFLSAGGSSLLLSCALVGVALNISRHRPGVEV